MRTPTASELLTVWESAFDRRPAERALALLAVAMPELGYGGVAACSIGARDEMLLALRERLFGAELASVAHCPACKTMVETTWHAGALRDSIGSSSPAPLQLEVVAEAHRISYRLPTSADLLAVGEEGDPDTLRNNLLNRCVLEASANGAPVALDKVPAAALAALEASMAAADPMADIDCALECPACGHGWSIDFDIGAYLWNELHAWAQRLLVDVHKLARAYGWREADILAMSPGRRSLYVEMSAS
jgi:hypothetical protein